MPSRTVDRESLKRVRAAVEFVEGGNLFPTTVSKRLSETAHTVSGVGRDDRYSQLSVEVRIERPGAARAGLLDQAGENSRFSRLSDRRLTSSKARGKSVQFAHGVTLHEPFGLPNVKHQRARATASRANGTISLRALRCMR